MLRSSHDACGCSTQTTSTINLKRSTLHPTKGKPTGRIPHLTPLIMVRIQVPQPYTSLIRPCIFSFRGLRNSPDTSPSRVFRISAAQAIVDSAFPMSSSWCHRFDASIPAKLQSFLPRSISMMTMSIEPLLSLKPTTIPNDRGVRGGPSHNHIRFIRFNFFPDGHLATTSE